jgi:hypothetical protein
MTPAKPIAPTCGYEWQVDDLEALRHMTPAQLPQMLLHYWPFMQVWCARTGNQPYQPWCFGNTPEVAARRGWLSRYGVRA